MHPHSHSLTQRLHDMTLPLSHWWSSLANGTTALEAAGGVAVASGIFFVAVIFTATRPNRDLAKHLDHYQIRTPEKKTTEVEGMVTIPFLQRFGDLLTGAARKKGVAETLELKISRAGLAVSSGELLVISVIGGALLAIAGGVIEGPLGFLLAAVIAGMVPAALLNLLAARRLREFEAQLPDVLKLLSASLRAGFSLLQGLDSLVGQVGDPMGAELRRAFAATRVGLPVEEALQGVADRVGSKEFQWVVMAIQIQREVGGNLAEILDSVAQTMMARASLRREVRTLTAEGRFSAYILVGLPPALGVMVYMSNRAYIDTLFNTRLGNIVLLVGLALEAAGGLWLRKTVTIEI